MNTTMDHTTSATVFLGVPAVLTSKQQALPEQWLGWLKGQSLHVVRLERATYSQDPWRRLTGLLSETDGVVLLGFRQLDAGTGTWRPHTKEEEHAAGWWTSPWLSLEAGMAVMSGLPLLVAPEEGVQEGVFSPDVWGGQVYGAAISSPGKTGTEWRELVYRHWILRKHSQAPAE